MSASVRLWFFHGNPVVQRRVENGVVRFGPVDIDGVWFRLSEHDGRPYFHTDEDDCFSLPGVLLSHVTLVTLVDDVCGKHVEIVRTGRGVHKTAQWRVREVRPAGINDVGIGLAVRIEGTELRDVIDAHDAILEGRAVPQVSYALPKDKTVADPTG